MAQDEIHTTDQEQLQAVRPLEDAPEKKYKRVFKSIFRFLAFKSIRAHKVRKTFYSVWALLTLIAISLALSSLSSTIFNGSVKPSRNWDLINIVSLSFVAITIIMIVITHKVDELRDGSGIRDKYKALNQPALDINADLVSAIMTRQSIHIAVALGLVVVIVQGGRLDPGGDSPSLRDVLSQFQICVAWIATGGFSLSVVLILISALCYSYSCQFKWNNREQIDLARKGLKLDILSWYVFTVSLILSIAIISPLLCIIINASFGFLLLYYYFFRYPRPEVTEVIQVDN
jgi:hypothetical protein